MAWYVWAILGAVVGVAVTVFVLPGMIVRAVLRR